MKVLIQLLVLALIPLQACQAQFSIKSDQGNVTIGTDGTINVQGGPGQARGGNVRISPGGIDVHDGAQNVRISPTGITGTTSSGGHRATTTIRSGGGSVTSIRGGGSASVRTGASSRGAAVVRSTNSNANVGVAASMADDVGTIELAVYGHKNNGMPLLARVEKLETENLGKKGEGAVRVRIDVLAKTLGVNLKPATVTTTSTSKQSVSVTTAGPGSSIQVDADEGGSAIVLNQNNERQTISCNRQHVVVNGNNCNLTLSGHCKSLTLNGNHNTVRMSSVEDVVANGNNNSALWPRSLTPRVTNNGSNNNLQPQ